MSAPPDLTQPFPGLRPYELEDAPLFFGRHTHVAEMIALLEQRRFLAVVGASGSGKSSLVRAGLLPAITDGYLAVNDESDDVWHIAIMRPGDDPYLALAESLVKLAAGESSPIIDQAHRTARINELLRSSQFGLTYALRELGLPGAEHVVLLVDQFEELFRFRGDEMTRRRAGLADESSMSERRNEANAFVNLLLKSTEQTEQSAFVILTMRSDFLGNCDAFIGLPEAISRSQYLTPRLTRSQLEEAIRSPLRLFNTQIEDALVTRILNDVGTEPDQLPLMQHALMRTWERTLGLERKSRQSSSASPSMSGGKAEVDPHSLKLCIADYEAVGGVHGALNQHADEIFHNLGDDKSRPRLQYVAERLFCSLSERRENGPLTRRPIKVDKAAREAGATDGEVESVASAFQAANLLVFSPAEQPLGPKTRLDISHESLLRQWKRLKSWIDAEAKSALSYRRLIDAINSGEQFLSDTHLAQAQEWLKFRKPNADWTMRYDGTESADQSLLKDSLELIARTQVESERKANAAREVAEQEQARVRREAEADVKRARKAVESAVIFRRITMAAVAACLVAVVCLGFALKYLRDAKSATKKANDNLIVAEQAKKKAEEAESKAVVAKQSAIDSQARAETQQIQANLENEKHFWQFAILARDNVNPDPIKASHLFLRGAKSLSRIQSVNETDTNRNPMGTFAERDETKLSSLSVEIVQGIRRDWLAASTVDRPLIRSWLHDGEVDGAQFSRDESRVLTWSDDNTARLWDVTKSEPLRIFIHDNKVNGAQFSSDQSRVLTWSADGTARLWDVTNSMPLQTYKHDNGSFGGVNGAQFSRNESHVLTWSNDFTARLWDVTKSVPLQTFKHDYLVTGAQFSRDESRVLTWSHDKTVRLWDVTKSVPLQTFKHDGTYGGDADISIGAQFSRNESRVLTWSDDKTVRLWDVTKSLPLQTFNHDGVVRGAQFSLDESGVLSWSDDKTARLWDLTKSVPPRIFKHDGEVRGAQFSRDESLVLTWSGDTTARLWDVTTSELLRTFRHNNVVNGALFRDDESSVLTWSSDNTARLWNVTNSMTLQTFAHSSPINGAQFSRDESRVLTWSNDKTVRFWDVTKSQPLRTFKHGGRNFGGAFSQGFWGVNLPQPSQDEFHVLILSEDNSVQLWEPTMPKLLQTFKPDFSFQGAQFTRDESRVLSWGDDVMARLSDVTTCKTLLTFEHHRQVFRAEFSRDESRVLTWSGDGTARLWDVTKSELLQTFNHKRAVNGARLSRDESRVMTWSSDNTARLWDVTKSEPLQTFKHDGRDREDAGIFVVLGAQFSHDESRVLTWSNDNTARLWDVTKSKPLQTFDHGNSFGEIDQDFLGVHGAQFSHDDSQVLTWSGDHTARLWDVTRQEPLQIFHHDNWVVGARFSRDESRVLTWSEDSTARLWDVTRPQPLQMFHHDKGKGVVGAQFSLDESRVLTWSGDGTARLWDVTKSEPLQTLRHDGEVFGAQFSRGESGVLTWSNDRTARLWDMTDSNAVLSPKERILELEVRSAATLDDNFNLRTLKFAEWIDKVKSPEYQSIQRKLAGVGSSIQTGANPNPPLDPSVNGEGTQAKTSSNPAGKSKPKTRRLHVKQFPAGDQNWLLFGLAGLVSLVIIVVIRGKPSR